MLCSVKQYFIQECRDSTLSVVIICHIVYASQKSNEVYPKMEFGPANCTFMSLVFSLKLPLYPISYALRRWGFTEHFPIISISLSLLRDQKTLSQHQVTWDHCTKAKEGEFWSSGRELNSKLRVG